MKQEETEIMADKDETESVRQRSERNREIEGEREMK